MTQAYDGAGAPLAMEGSVNGLIRTDCHCHNCSKGFIAEIDAQIDGEHIAECPHCGHEHYRRIKGGVVTEDRWGSANHDSGQAPRIKARRVWKHDVLVLQTQSASQFIRDKWLERSKGG